MINKNPFTAAIINFFFWGMGYVYYGKRATFGCIIFAGFFFVHLPLLYKTDWLEIPGIFTLIGHIIISIAFAMDIISFAKVKSKEKSIERFPVSQA